MSGREEDPLATARGIIWGCILGILTFTAFFLLTTFLFTL